MDQIKIGKFITEKRKEKKLTQQELAEKLGITDRAISKWENGVCLPDSGTMPELSEILGITINDLFSEEVVDMKDNEKKLEENLLEMAKMKEERDQKLLHMEIVMGILCLIPIFVSIIIAGVFIIDEKVKVIMIATSIIPIIISTPFAIMIEQKAGFYECKNCHHKYVPKYGQVFLSPHINRTRYMKCPKCGKRTWNKKVISK